jgi:hypothetical protein
MVDGSHLGAGLSGEALQPLDSLSPQHSPPTPKQKVREDSKAVTLKPL